ncbi:MAG: hypothetical protein JWN73_3305 [Betaproteobacteria bacterium]|nr:hypothetical protein [Betaproteobacteria bacterium]
MFLLSMGLLLCMSEPGTVVRTVPEWRWACDAFAVVVTALYAWYYLRESRRERRGKKKSDKKDSVVALLVFAFMAFVFNSITANSLTPLFMRDKSTESVDLLQDAQRVTHYTTKQGKDRTRTCNHYVVFKLPDGHSDGMCTDLTRGEPLVVPGKGKLELRKGLAGEAYLGIRQ